MKHLVLPALAAFLLIACGQTPAAQRPAETADAVTQPAGPNLCAARAESTWQGIKVEASTAGPACAQATATIVFRNAAGGELLRFEAPVEHIFSLRDATDSEAMNAALTEWIDQRNSTLATTAALPPWQAGADSPVNGEFPFYVEEGVTQARYAAARAARLPMFCHTQGLESLACYVLEDGALTKLGAQSFPG